MERAESRSAPSPQSDHLVPADDSPTVAVAISVCEGNPKLSSFSRRDAMDRGSQACDNLWVDLGGEG